MLFFFLFFASFLSTPFEHINKLLPSCDLLIISLILLLVKFVFLAAEVQINCRRRHIEHDGSRWWSAPNIHAIGLRSIFPSEKSSTNAKRGGLWMRKGRNDVNIKKQCKTSNNILGEKTPESQWLINLCFIGANPSHTSCKQCKYNAICAARVSSWPSSGRTWSGGP